MGQHTYSSGNPKSKTYNTITKNENKATQAYYKRKPSNHKRKNKKKKGTKKNCKNNRETRFKMAISTYSSIITLNIYGLNDPLIKRQSGRLD